MKKKNMIMVGLLVLVCVLFLAVGYAGITKKITAQLSVGGKANPDNFKIGYGILTAMNDNGLDAFTFNSSASFYNQVGVFDKTGIQEAVSIYEVPTIDPEEVVTDKTIINAYGLNVKGEKVLYYIPVFNMSNDLAATKITASDPVLTGKDANNSLNTPVNCGDYYKITKSLVKYDAKNYTTTNPVDAGFITVAQADKLKPYSTFSSALADWKNGDVNALYFLKVEIETLHTLAEDTYYDHDMGSNPIFKLIENVNYCTWTVDVTAEAAVNK